MLRVFSNESIVEFLKEHCMEELGVECRTLGCFMNSGYDPQVHTRDDLILFKPTCPAHELGKAWRKEPGARNEEVS
jgi:hypothetical protein